MTPLAADENFRYAIVRGLLRLNPRLDVVRIQDQGLSGADDPVVLEWAASQGRVVLTHDVRTMTFHADERVKKGLPMPGLVLVPQPFSMAKVLEDLHALAECSVPGEWSNCQLYLPWP